MSLPAKVPQLDPADLCARYDVVLLDSCGVLVDERGALPGALRFLAELEARGTRWMVLSNDASRLRPSSVARYQACGLPISAEHLLTSGDLIAPHFEEQGLAGRRCVVLGSAESCALVSAAGGVVVDTLDPVFEVLVVCGDNGYAFRETIEALVGHLYARLAAGHEVSLVLPNPDLVYPRGNGRIGMAAGSVALLIEGALRLRFPDASPRFTGLGKPNAPIFERALALLEVAPSDRVVMVGDQLATDIAGAQAMGLDSVLIATGVCDPKQLPSTGPRPTAWLADLILP